MTALPSPISAPDFDTEIAEKGWVRFEQVLPKSTVDSIRTALDAVQAEQLVIQRANGVADGVAGSVHCIIGYDDALDSFLSDLPLRDFIERYFGKPYILNNYGGVINKSGGKIYVNNQHRDVRDFTYPLRLMLNMLVMVDDFTIENGATKILEGSHKTQKNDHNFEKEAIQITGKAGDIVLWDSNLLHAAGRNTTDQVRRALTLCFCRPYIKPTIDFLQALSPEFLARQTPFMKTLLGADAQPAPTVDAFFQPKERWTYKMG